VQEYWLVPSSLRARQKLEVQKKEAVSFGFLSNPESHQE